jgi:hypothetical protein
MSEEIEKKSGIKFTYVHTKCTTTIVATAIASELPLIAAMLDMVEESKIWRVRITDFTNGIPILDGVCYRGRSFAERVAREAIRGCFSKLGKRSRMAANKQKKAEVQHD